MIFFFFICLFSKLQRQKQIFVFRNSAVKLQHVLFENEPFLWKMLIFFFSSTIRLYIGKNPVEKLCKVFLEMELKTYTAVGLKFVFEKIKFKVLHYIQHFIHQHPERSKDQISMIKSIFINYFTLKYCHTLYWSYKR